MLKHKISSTLLVVTMILFMVQATRAEEDVIEAGKEKSAVCQGCHGEDGNSISPDFPHLAGQHSRYLLKQISNFQSGARTNETMNAMVAGLSAEDAQDIAAYFASKKILPDTTAPDSIALETGKMIYRGGNTYTGVPACSSCHGPNGAGNSPAKFPRLAGQRIEYVMKQLQDFKAKQRSNDPNEIMQTIASKMTDNEIRSVATYIAYIPTDRKL